MSATINAIFPTRRAVELAVEHLVQEYGIERTDIFIEPAGDANSAGSDAAGSDAADDDGKAKDAALEGNLRVSVDVNADERAAVLEAFRDVGALEIED